MFKVTLEWLYQYRTGSGGYRRDQVEALGLDWPPQKGWLRGSVGKMITFEQKSLFEAEKESERQSKLF